MTVDSRQTLTYFVELEGRELLALIERPGLLDLLARSGAELSIAMRDLSAERRSAMQALAARGIPLTAWLVVDETDGYWLGADNAGLARQRYREVRAFARGAGLPLAAVGLDLETPQEDARALLEEGRRALLRLLRARRSREALERARRLYGELVEEIRDEGYRAETYQFPVLLDERRAGGSLLSRTLGLVDVQADREVVMLYESLVPPPLGSLLVDAYGPECQAIGVGITGGGVPFVLDALGGRRLQGADLVVSLRRARRYTPHLYVFSLEGCLEGGSLGLLAGAALEAQAPSRLTGVGRGLRGAASVLLRCERLAEWLLR